MEYVQLERDYFFTKLSGEISTNSGESVQIRGESVLIRGGSAQFFNSWDQNKKAKKFVQSYGYRET